MWINKYISGLVLFFFVLGVSAQDQVSFKVKLSKEKLGLNERLRVQFVMNKDGDNFVVPDFEGFRVIMGPSQQISTSWVNGKKSYSKLYSYTLQPIKKGKLTIEQAEITIDKKQYKTAVKTVTVTAAVKNPNAPPSANDVAGENLHLVAEVSNPNPYINEPVTVIYKLYVSQTINVKNYRATENPKYKNFWSQDMPVNKPVAKQGKFKGEDYVYVILKRVVLYPQKSGELNIEPLTLDVLVEVPTKKRNFFGGYIYEQTNKTVSAGSRTINVKALPEAGKPASFTGAVGDFNFFVTTSKSHLNATESLQAKVEVNGKGNLKLFKLPKLNLPSSLEVYDPEHNEKVRTNYSGMEGKISDNYTIVPSYRGKYPIPSIDFSYFNPKTEKYHTLSSDEIVVNVLEGPTNKDEASNTTANGNKKQAVETTGEQFSFIKTKPNLSQIAANSFFGSRSFYLSLLLPLLLIPIALIIGKKRRALANDVAGNKVRKANRLARRYLSTAKKTLGQKDAFYVALEKALHNYLKAKLKIETSEFSKDKIISLFNNKGVDQETTDGFISLLKNCEMARYSPFSNVQMKQDYDKASNVISQLDKQI